MRIEDPRDADDPGIDVDDLLQMQRGRVGRRERPQARTQHEARVDRTGERRGQGDHAVDALLRIELGHQVLADETALAVRDDDHIAQVVLLEIAGDEPRRVGDGPAVAAQRRKHVHRVPGGMQRVLDEAGGTPRSPRSPGA